MTNAQKIKMALAYINMSESALAREIGASPQAFHQRMKTDKFTHDEMGRMAEIMGARFVSYFEFDDGTKV